MQAAGVGAASASGTLITNPTHAEVCYDDNDSFRRYEQPRDGGGCTNSLHRPAPHRPAYPPVRGGPRFAGGHPITGEKP